jgi:hypothetical protein
MGRLGSVIMPYMIFPLLNHIGPTSVFILFSIIGFLGTISSLKVPFDTVGLNLDGNTE